MSSVAHSGTEVNPGFAISIQTQGMLHPGRLRIDYDVTAMYDASDVEILVNSPDVEIARLNSWTGGRHPVSQPMVAADRQAVHLSKGSSYSGMAILDIPLPGYYNVIVSALGTPAAGETGLIQNRIHEDLWLWVSPSGGRVTPTFDESLFPPGFRRQPGPLEAIQTGPARRGLAPASNQYAVIQVAYTNQDSSNGQGGFYSAPLANARVYMEVFDQYEYRLISAGDVGYTDANGEFTVYCPYAGGYDTHTYYIYAENEKVEVYRDEILTGVQLYPGDSFCDDGATTHLLGADRDPSRIFAQLNLAVPQAESFFGFSRPKIRAEATSQSKSWYDDTGPDIVYLTDTSIWGQTGISVLIHEYGHAYHEMALGGINPGRTGCGDHAIDVSTNYGCALAEGFAEYFALALRGDETYYYAYLPSHSQIPYDPKTEGAVAAFLYDLTDDFTSIESTENHDNTYYPGSYLGGIMKTCRVNESGWKRASGIDHIVYCLEQRLSSQGTYWSGRSSVTGFEEFASEPGTWDADSIGENWKWNLYAE